jgi:hypothetical protein
VDDSCRRVPGHVLPRQRSDRGEGEDGVKKIECVESEVGSSHRLPLDIADGMELPPQKAGAKGIDQASLVKGDDMAGTRDSLIKSLDLTSPH